MMCEMFTFMWTSVNFGVLTITLVQMMIDLYLFGIFFSVVLVGFCLALLGLSETAPHEHHIEGAATTVASAAGRLLSVLRAPVFEAADDLAAAYAGRTLQEAVAAASSPPAQHVWNSMDQIHDDFTNRVVDPDEATIELGLVYQPFWAMFAEFDLDELARIPFGLPLMWFYVLIANIVLVNMLIAMFSETYTRIKRHAIQEYHYQHYLYIFEYQHCVHAVPPPFNFPLLLWDTCANCFSSREYRRNQARMNIDDGYDEDPSYASPAGIDREEGLSLMRKYVQRYILTHTDLSSASSIMNLAERIKDNVYDMEERIMHEFEHIHNTLIAPTGSGAKMENKLNHIATALDRMIRGRNDEAAKALIGIAKDKVRGADATTPKPQAPPASTDRSAKSTKRHGSSRV